MEVKREAETIVSMFSQEYWSHQQPQEAREGSVKSLQ